MENFENLSIIYNYWYFIRNLNKDWQRGRQTNM
jgi:hypothetical protein